jgi:tetratricopeptide (TPR) repeat protein
MNPQPSRVEPIAFYILLITTILAPLAFLPTPYIILDAVKTVLIAIGTLISAILYGVVAYKERSITLPSRSVTWTTIIVGLSLVVSSFTSVHLGKSFFGQGFELTTASFILVLFVAALVVFTAVYRKSERVPLLYMGLTVPFLLLAILHGARLLAGPEFVSLGVLSSVTSTLVGNWYDLATYALIITFVVVPALMFLPLSRRVKIIYWVVLVVAFIAAFIINSVLVWTIGALVFLLLVIAASITRRGSTTGGITGFLKRLTWLPLVLFVISGVFALWGTSMAKPVIEKYNATYSTLTLPWQLTLDVDSEVLKNSPLFGIGPNHFGQAYVAYKPAAINPTYAWSAEFNYACSLFATFVATQGIVGAIAWILFLIFLSILVVRALRRLPQEPQARFAIVSSSFMALFLWIMSAFSVPSHAILFYTYLATAIAVASIVRSSIVTPLVILPHGARSRNIVSIVTVVLVIAGVLWGVVYVKDFIALSYFGSGVKALTVRSDPSMADEAFSKAYSLNTSDVYLQARAEAGLAQANKLISSARSDMSASTTQEIATKVFEVLNTSITYSQAAIAYDPTNYYNYASEARVSERAASVRMDKAYENAVNSYAEAIRRNPLNPALYLSLAQLQASQNKLDDALRTLGAALQVKNNYLEAIFMLSQVTAAQGNLKDAITAAQVATELNPQNSVLFFQLGLLHYNNKDYVSSAKALETALKLQSDYANAQYFLGLSYARLNNISSAIEQFSRLAQSNPDNQEVAFILANLQAGKSPFADAKPPVTPTPEKRSSLPIKEKKK